MTYKTNTPNYNTKSNIIANYKDFMSDLDKEKEELKDIKRSIKKNDDENHKIPRNSKLRFDKITRKMTDTTLPEVEDKLDQIEDLREGTDSLKVDKPRINKYNTQYSLKNSPFKGRGFSEGVSMLFKENDLEKGKEKAKDLLSKIEKGHKYSELEKEKKSELIVGLRDFIEYIENGIINESHFY